MSQKDFGGLCVRLGNELSRDARRIVLQRCGCPPSQIDDHSGLANFWGWLAQMDRFRADKVDASVFDGFPVVQRVIKIYLDTTPEILSLEQIAAKDSVWDLVSRRLPEIQLQLDTELFRSGKRGTKYWWHQIPVRNVAPIIQSTALFNACAEESCLPELWRAISKVGPRTGLELGPVPESAPIPAAQPQPQTMMMASPLVAAVQAQETFKTLTATQLLQTTHDVALKKLVQRLMLALGENDAWLAFAKHKGALRGAAAEQRISEAQSTGEPERHVIPELARVPGYLASVFLADLKAIHLSHVTTAVEAIELHFASEMSAAESRGDQVAKIHSSVRQWLTDNQLCDTPTQVQHCLDALLAAGVSSLHDLKELDAADFQSCGMLLVKAKKAARLVAEIK